MGFNPSHKMSCAINTKSHKANCTCGFTQNWQKEKLSELRDENKRLNAWIDNLEMAAKMESDSIRIRKFKAIKDGKTLEQILKEKKYENK